MKIAGKSLSLQLLKAVLSIYFSITLLVTLTQMLVEYLHTRDMIRNEQVSVERTFTPALATALWEINHEQLDAVLQGIVDLQLITSIRLTDTKGQVTVKAVPRKTLGADIEHRFKISHRFSGQDVPLADVTFATASDVVLDRLRLGYQMILISALIKSTALTLLFIWAFRRNLSVPLAKFADAVAAVDLDSLGRRHIDLGQTQENELARLEHAFNRMLSTLDQERQVHDASLEALNQGLEMEVRKRTEELEWANARLEQLVRTDPLTGAANRRYFVEQANVEIQRAWRGNLPLSLLMIDLDHFKRINDTWGHAAGDAVLCNFVGIAAVPLRTADLLARIGGEEFAILLPGTELGGATEVAQRIVEAARQQSVSFEGAQIAYRLSIGVAQLQAGELKLDPFLSRVDTALYQAKHMGRDRVVPAGKDIPHAAAPVL